MAIIVKSIDNSGKSANLRMDSYMKKSLFILSLALALHSWSPPGAEAQEPALDFQWITYGTDITEITTGARFIHHNWYSETCLGGFSAFDNRESAFFLSQNLGRRFSLASWLYVAGDLGYRHIIPDGSENPAIDTGKYFTLEARLKLEANYNQHLSAFVGIGSTNIYNGYSLSSDSHNETILFWGVGLL